MMAQPVPHQSTTDKKRVKVYELRNNDWFDRGTGFCSASVTTGEDGQPRDPRVIVQSEDQPDRVLLETKICKEDGFQKQQETLIVWTEPTNGVDMALSFQEAEGCAMIWRFVNGVQQSFQNGLSGADDSLSDDLAMDVPNSINLPAAELGNLPEIESSMRVMSSSAAGRDALAKTIMAEDYIMKLIPLVDVAEDLESLSDLHRLCNIMKIIILLNDTTIIEHAVSNECIIGVVGALEYDPDFPSHKANHRSWLQNDGRYKEVVSIQDDQIKKKIHQTYRLQYLKDVVLARILDDPTFSVLNSLIFFNQVDIVQHLQSNSVYLDELFAIFASPDRDQRKKKDAVLLIQQCCAIAKNLQPPARQNLYTNLLTHGLLQVINFGLRHTDVGVRVGATDILVSMIDHDPQMIRQTLYRQLNEHQVPLTDSLIELLIVEVDLGVKSQISDAIKVLLDPGHPLQAQEAFAKANGEFAAGRARPQPQPDPQQEVFLSRFYDSQSAQRLFKPLLDLKDRSDMSFAVQQAGMFTYLIEILCFFIRQHHHHSKYFVLQNNIVQRVAQLLDCPEYYLKLVAIRFFRHLISLNDDFYVKHLAEKRVLGPILQVASQSASRDNLLSSASLEFFEYIKKENTKDLVKYLVSTYRDRLEELSYIDTFRELILRYDQSQGFSGNVEYYLDHEDDIARRPTHPNPRLMEQIAVDQEEEDYWNTSDNEDDQHGPKSAPEKSSPASSKLLVDYPSDEEGDENADPNKPAAALTDTENPSQHSVNGLSATSTETTTQAAAAAAAAVSPPERISEKRRREEEDDDELGKLMHSKRRNSSSAGSVSSTASGGPPTRRKKSFSGAVGSLGGTAPKRMAISLSSGQMPGAAGTRNSGSGAVNGEALNGGRPHGIRINGVHADEGTSESA